MSSFRHLVKEIKKDQIRIQQMYSCKKDQIKIQQNLFLQKKSINIL